MARQFGVCVYVGTELPLDQQLAHLHLALSRGCAMVMTSLHLPEMDLDRAVNAFGEAQPLLAGVASN